jgi:hypothetical protein
MKLAPHFIAAGCLLVGASALFGRQPMPLSGPVQEILPAPDYVEGEPLLDSTNDENFWAPPPMPPLPYGFTWDGYAGAAIEHDIYGYQRLHPPPRKTVSCYGLFVGLADSVHVMFSYPTPHRPPPMYCPKGGGRCVPGKFSYGTRSHGGGCTCQSQPATIVYEPALSAPQPVPVPEPAPTYQPQIIPPRNVVQPRPVAPARPIAPAHPVAPARPLTPVVPLVPPVLIDDSGLPAAPLVSEERGPAVIAPTAPPPVLTEDPPELPQNVVPAPGSTLPRNKIPAR